MFAGGIRLLGIVGSGIVGEVEVVIRVARSSVMRVRCAGLESRRA